MRNLFAILILLLSANCKAQAIDNTLRHEGGNYFSMVYENDVFNHTDQYYTQGIQAEYSRHVNTKFFKECIATSMGVSLMNDVYTPTSILSDSILYSDRPFAACLMASGFVNVYDTVHRQRLMYSITAGVIGPAAGGEEMQTTIHRNIGSAIPHGWQYQVHNDALVNLEVEYERQLLSMHIFSIAAIATGRVGTLQTGAAAGLFATAGLIKNRGSFRLYLYAQPLVHVVGYDATLQGGVFDNSSPYTIAAKDMARVTLSNRLGIVARYKHVQLEYAWSVLTREFSTGGAHAWGRVAASWCWQ